MSDDIDAVKASAADIINKIFESKDKINDSRIAVVGYNDPSTQTYLSFTDQPNIDDRKAAAIGAINSILVDGGGDIPEVVNAGLIRALSGQAGEWREDADARRIILFGDAPPKDTELRARVLALAADTSIESHITSSSRVSTSILGDIVTSNPTQGLAVTNFKVSSVDASGSSIVIPVQIFTILIGNDASTASDFKSLASATGGKYFTAADASKIVDALITVINEPVNSAPVITANDGKDDATLSVVENNSKVTQITATDSDAGSTLTYSISGGTDASLFAMDSKTGTLSFKTLPDFEKPADANKNNEYEVSVQASDGSLADTQNLKINVTNVANESAPVITANGGKVDATLSVVENNSKATQITATDSDASSTLTYSISGGTDASWFVIDSKTGALSFKTLPDFEKPTDTNKNNEYEVSVQVSDGSLTDVQNLKINVTNMTNEFNGSNNQDVLFGTANNDFMNGYGGNDVINGWTGNDTIFAGNGNDLVYGGAGSDVIYGEAGNDILKGDIGADTFYISTGFGHDSILDFNSEDKVGIVSAGINNFADLTTHMSQSGADTIIKLNNADDLVLKNIGIATLTATEFFFV